MKRYHYRPQDRFQSADDKGTKRKFVIGVVIAVSMAGLAYGALGSHVEDDVRTDQPKPELASPAMDGENTFDVQVTNQSEMIEGAVFQRCGRERITCVVDGDTFWLNGTKIRVSDIDTPEISQPKCSSEKETGERATVKLISLLNSGPFEIVADGQRDTDRFGRKLRQVVRDGVSIGDQLVAAGLARTWTGKREPWC